MAGWDAEIDLFIFVFYTFRNYSAHTRHCRFTFMTELFATTHFTLIDIISKALAESHYCIYYTYTPRHMYIYAYRSCPRVTVVTARSLFGSKTTALHIALYAEDRTPSPHHRLSMEPTRIIPKRDQRTCKLFTG